MKEITHDIMYGFEDATVIVCEDTDFRFNVTLINIDDNNVDEILKESLRVCNFDDNDLYTPITVGHYDDEGGYIKNYNYDDDNISILSKYVGFDVGAFRDIRRNTIEALLKIVHDEMILTEVIKSIAHSSKEALEIMSIMKVFINCGFSVKINKNIGVALRLASYTLGSIHNTYFTEEETDNEYIEVVDDSSIGIEHLEHSKTLANLDGWDIETEEDEIIQEITDKPWLDIIFKPIIKIYNGTTNYLNDVKEKYRTIVKVISEAGHMSENDTALGLLGLI